MNNQEKDNQFYSQNYQEWLEQYQKAFRESVKRSAAKTVPRTGDPMMDYKAIAETALFPW
jgi:hypothetical protein